MQNLKYFTRIFCFSSRPIISMQHCVTQGSYSSLNAAKLWSSPIRIAGSTNIRFVSFFRNTREETFKKNDNIPDNYKIIYRAPMYNYILAIHSVNSAGILVILATFISKMYMLTSDLSFALGFEFIFWSTGLLVLLGAISRLLYIYILRIYADEKGSYILVKSGIIPFICSKIKFSQGEIVHLPPKGIMPWQDNKYTVKNQPAIILDHYFRKPSDYNDMFQKRKSSIVT